MIISTVNHQTLTTQEQKGHTTLLLKLLKVFCYIKVFTCLEVPSDISYIFSNYLSRIKITNIEQIS